MKNNDHCDFECCHDYGLACLNELLADIRRLSVVAVVFLYQNYQITVFTTKHNKITFGTLF